MSQNAEVAVFTVISGNCRGFECHIILNGYAIFTVFIDIGRILCKNVDDALKCTGTVECGTRTKNNLDTLDEFDGVSFIEPDTGIADVIHWDAVLQPKNS